MQVAFPSAEWQVSRRFAMPSSPAVRRKRTARRSLPRWRPSGSGHFAELATGPLAPALSRWERGSCRVLFGLPRLLSARPCAGRQRHRAAAAGLRRGHGRGEARRPGAAGPGVHRRRRPDGAAGRLSSAGPARAAWSWSISDARMLCNLTLNGVVKAIRPLTLDAGQGLRDRHGQFRSARGAGAGRGEEGELHQGAGQARGRRRLALPDQQPARRPPRRWATPSASATSSIPRGSSTCTRRRFTSARPTAAWPGRSKASSSTPTCSATR